MEDEDLACFHRHPRPVSPVTPVYPVSCVPFPDSPRLQKLIELGSKGPHWFPKKIGFLLYGV